MTCLRREKFFVCNKETQEKFSLCTWKRLSVSWASFQFTGQTTNLRSCDVHTDPYDRVPGTFHFLSLTLPWDIALQTARDTKPWNSIGTKRMIGFSVPTVVLLSEVLCLGESLNGSNSCWGKWKLLFNVMGGRAVAERILDWNLYKKKSLSKRN
jgi:hypothetical protein